MREILQIFARKRTWLLVDREGLTVITHSLSILKTSGDAPSVCEVTPEESSCTRSSFSLATSRDRLLRNYASPR